MEIGKGIKEKLTAQEINTFLYSKGLYIFPEISYPNQKPESHLYGKKYFMTCIDCKETQVVRYVTKPNMKPKCQECIKKRAHDVHERKKIILRAYGTK